ncbi:MAG: prolipoprotein diacylglyceryl transferase [Rhodobacteraceae bacterium]|nr:prolipoprotein diacylglyceryl transferase [Paracoccaceae bacterium]
MTPAIFLPSINPELFAVEVFGISLAIRWYALSYIAGFLISLIWFVQLVKRPSLWNNNVPPMDPQSPERLLTWIIIGIIIGGRLGYILFYRLEYFASNPFEMIKIWTGGMSFHGAGIGMVLATIFFCKKNKFSLGSTCDAIALTITPGLLLGRIANFINGELYGRITDVSWAVVFSDGPASFCVDSINGICSRHPSQLYEALLEGVLLCGVLSVLAYRYKAFHKPWLLSGVLFVGYGLARGFVEYFRKADSQFISETNPMGYVIRFSDWGGLSMGQLLSLPMILVGVCLIYYALSQSRA